MAEVETEGPIFRDIRRYYCQYCGICRSKKALITAHVLSDHQDEIKEQKLEDEKIDGPKAYTCEKCGASFKKPAYLRQHMQSHSFERPFVCPIEDCHSSYRRNDHLNRHLLQHQGKLFKCPVENCCSEFSVQGNIKRHLKEFHDRKDKKKSLKCPVENCDMEFYFRNDLKRHLKEIHGGKQDFEFDMGQKKFVCEVPGCGKAFAYESRLRKHGESHVMPEYIETSCADPGCNNKKFTSIKCLKAHIRECHQHLICEVCGSKQLSKNIRRHLRSHEGIQTERLKCNFEGCSHESTSNSNLRQHVKAVHLDIRPYVCGVAGCGMRFSFKHVRDNHERSGCHAYVPGDLEEFDERFRSRLVGGRKRNLPSIETLTRKRVAPPSQSASVLVEGSEYLSWLLSSDDSNEC